MKVIGLGHRTRGLGGCHLIMMEGCSMQATGREIVAGLNMTITGTATETGILTVDGNATGTGIVTAINSA